MCVCVCVCVRTCACEFACVDTDTLSRVLGSTFTQHRYDTCSCMYIQRRKRVCVCACTHRIFLPTWKVKFMVTQHMHDPQHE